jgi:PRTRC genetic system protein A
MTALYGILPAITGELPPCDPHKLCEYVIGGNGLFVRAKRKGLEAIIPIDDRPSPFMEVSTVVKLQEHAPHSLLDEIVSQARKAAPLERLFYLLPDPWRLVVPDQMQTSGSVRPVDPYSEGSHNALIEIHSHNDMPAFWSSADDRDETGFRIYGVIGRVSTTVEIKLRVGIYGYFYQVPVAWVFDQEGEHA